MVDADEFVDGASVEWSGLATGLVGGAFLAVILGIAGVIRAIADGVIGLLGDAGAWFEEVIQATVSILVEDIDVAVSSWESFADLVGPAAFPAGILMIVLSLAIVAEVVDRV